MFNKNILFYLFYFFSFLSLGYGVCMNNYRIMFLSLFTMFLFLVFDFFVNKFCLKVSYLFKFFLFSFLFLSEILGEAFSFYSVYYWWDDMLHFICGVLATYVGYVLYNFLNSDNNGVFALSLFSFCFSMCFGIVWECIEFGYDRYLGSDMQKDVVLENFNTSYFSSVDNIKSVNRIRKTVIYTDSDVIIINGYLDVGLFDTVNDLFIDMIGSFFSFSGIYFYKKRLHCLKSNL